MDIEFKATLFFLYNVGLASSMGVMQTSTWAHREHIGHVKLRIDGEHLHHVHTVRISDPSRKFKQWNFSIRDLKSAKMALRILLSLP